MKISLVNLFFSSFRRKKDLLLVDILTNPLPDEVKSIAAIDNARLLYHSCVNEDAIEKEGIIKILDIVNDLGGWPMIEGLRWNSSNFNLSRLITKVRDYGQSIIYSFGTSTDDRNSSTYYIRVSSKTNQNTKSHLFFFFSS